MTGKSLDKLSALLATISDTADMRDFLDALLTPKERARLALRWQLVCRLEAGEHQRAIAQALHISLCKITRGSRELKQRRRFRNIVRKYMHDRKGNTP
jgi:TrpR family transcriptional regulator, trp operon repressor